MNCKKQRIRANTIAEMPVALTVFLLFLLLPLIDLAVLAFRTSFIHSAANNAAHSAGRAKTFKENSDTGELSALNIAKRDAIATKNAGTAGVNFSDSDVQLFILGSPIKPNKAPIRQSNPLDEVSTKDYLYQIEVSVSGTVDPLVTLSDAFFGKVPGLSAPFPVQATYRQFVEHPAGLAK